MYRTAVRVGQNELRGQIRRSRYERLFEFGRGTPRPEELLVVRQEQQRVDVVLSVLEPRQAELLVLRSHGFSYEELASTLDLNPSSIGTLALERNQDLLSARQRLAEAQGLLRQAGVRLAPTIESEGTTGRPLGTTGEEAYSAAFFYPIETGGKRQKRVTVAEFGLALTDAEVSERSRQLTFDVKRRAIEVLAARRKQAAIERLMGVSRESYQITKVRVDEGDAAPLEQQLLATELARVEVQQASFSGRATAALVELRQVLGTSDADLFAGPEQIGPTLAEVALNELKARSAASRQISVLRGSWSSRPLRRWNSSGRRGVLTLPYQLDIRGAILSSMSILCCLQLAARSSYLEQAGEQQLVRGVALIRNICRYRERRYRRAPRNAHLHSHCRRCASGRSTSARSRDAER